MNPTPTYKIGSEIIVRHEDALMKELPALYPDDAEREIVEQILIPQFRALVVQVLEKFEGASEQSGVVLPVDIPVLCGNVSDTIRENRALLDVDGLFKPVFERIQEVREEVAKELDEEFMQKCRDILAKKGITGRFSLLEKGGVLFRKTTFEPYGKGKADMLFPEVSEDDLIDKCRHILHEKGVHDRFSLLEKEVRWFIKEPFEPFGKGTAFASKILGRPVGPVSLSIIEEIADKIFPEVSEDDLMDKYRHILYEKGVHDRFSLLEKGAMWFQRESFNSFGKGLAFAARILGRTIGKAFSTSLLEEIADKLFPEVSEDDLMDKCRHILHEKGVHDRFSLLEKGGTWFTKQTFYPFGKGKSFAQKILGRSMEYVTNSVLEEIADKLFPEVSEDELLDKYRQIFCENGIFNRASLLGKGLTCFIKQTFEPFGKGMAFASKILGRPVGPVSLSIIEEIADKLFPENPEESSDDNP
jgi:hypothetical protein